MNKLQIVKLCKNLISIDSTTKNETKILKYIEQLLKENNIEFERIPVSKNRWNIFAKKGFGSSGVLFCGHCDTVPKTETWTMNPFEPKIKNDKLFGLGASDMKCGLAALLYCFINDKSDNNNGLLVTVGEEAGGFDGVNSFIKGNSLNNFKFALVADTSEFNIITEQSGLAGIDVTVHSKQRHTKNFYESNNPIHDATKIIVKLTEEFERIKTNKTTPLGNTPILSINKICSGIKTNIIPNNCTFSIDRRVSPNEELSEIEEFYENCFKKFKNISWKKRTWLQSAKNEENELVKHIKRISKTLKKTVKCETSIGVSEMIFLRNAGLKVVTFGPGLKKQAHTANEFIYIKDIKDYCTIISEIMERKQNDFKKTN